MDKKGSPRIYPLVPVGPSNVPNVDEQVRLLTQDFFAKDGQTLIRTTPPTYDQLYINKEESEAELQRLSALLKEKEEELKALPGKLPATLRWLVRQRAEENIKSNATVGTVAFSYYMISMITQLIGDPRLWENQGNNWSILPFCNNFFGWLGSQGYAQAQCCCRKSENEN